MPVVQITNVGSSANASAEGTLRRTVSLTADAASTTTALLVEGLPCLSFWLRQTVGALGASVIPQFAIRDITGATPVPEWLDLDAVVVLPFNVPVLLHYHFPAKLIRLSLTRSAGQATTVQIALGGDASGG